MILGSEDPLEKGMATHSSILVWKIPWTVEPGGLESIGSQRVRHDQATISTFTFPLTFQGGRTCWALLKETLAFLPLFTGAALKKLGDVQVTLGGTQ